VLLYLFTVFVSPSNGLQSLKFDFNGFLEIHYEGNAADHILGSFVFMIQMFQA